jgi:hypothetical protein
MGCNEGRVPYMFFYFVSIVSPEEKLYEYGVLGIVLVAVAMVAAYLFKIILKDRDKAINDRDSIVQDMFTKVLPALAHNTEVLEKRQELDRDLIHTLKDSNAQLERNSRAFDEARLIFKHGQNHGRSGGA